jgi:quercetin dioxygenase-like cupin family protein
MATIIQIDELAGRDIVRRFEGGDHGATASSFLIMEMPPGGGPVLHRHPYEEIFIVQEGEVTFTAAGETIEARAGQIVIVPPDTPHKFVAAGDGPLNMVTIHPAAHMVQEDLPED